MNKEEKQAIYNAIMYLAGVVDSISGREEEHIRKLLEPLLKDSSN
jgi:hypothetical protein